MVTLNIHDERRIDVPPTAGYVCRILLHTGSRVCGAAVPVCQSDAFPA